MLGIGTSNDEHQLGPFPRQHRVMIDISPRGTKKPGAIRRPFRIEITDRHQLYRSKSKRRVDVAISAGTGTDETDPKPARVFVIVDDVRDKRAAPLDYSPTTWRSAEVKTMKSNASEWPTLVARCQTSGSTVTVSPGLISDSVPSAIVWRISPWITTRISLQLG